MSEFTLIDWLRRYLMEGDSALSRARLLVPPGDDAAVLAATGRPSLFAADLLMDGVHFDLKQTSGELAGRKALAVNLSDIAAMAGEAQAVTVCLALPKRGGIALAKSVMRGIQELAVATNVSVAGGDTNSWDGPLVISIAITGIEHERGSVLRSGARVGDWICVTGGLGGSLAGKHLSFSPRLREASVLHATYGLHAMLDLSDGLAADLPHILTASQVGARLLMDLIPLSDVVRRLVDSGTCTPEQARYRALCDGEDFELCFTLPANAAAALIQAQPFGPALPVSHIGVVTADKELLWTDGTPVPTGGWVHVMD